MIIFLLELKSVFFYYNQSFLNEIFDFNINIIFESKYIIKTLIKYEMFILTIYNMLNKIRFLFSSHFNFLLDNLELKSYFKLFHISVFSFCY